jgi:histidine ammonia-lyase
MNAVNALQLIISPTYYDSINGILECNIFATFMGSYNGTLGYNFGMQGAQFTATSTTAENQMLSNPMYIHSIPNNNDNQDIVSMGTNAAIITARVIENAFEVLSIELITIIQAIDALEQKNEISSVTKKLYDDVRAIIPTFKEDQVMYPFIQKVKNYLVEN